MNALQALLLALLLLPFAAYAVVARMRPARYRALAARLGARHAGAGWFAPGTIVGPGFEIEATKVVKAFRTRVEVAVAESPGTFFLDPRFFAEFPDWAHARVSGAGTQRVFLWEIAVQRHVAPTREQRESLLHWLAEGPQLREVQAAARELRIRQIVIADKSVATDFGGIVTSFDRLQRTLELLQRLPRKAGRAREPVRKGA